MKGLGFFVKWGIAGEDIDSRGVEGDGVDVAAGLWKCGGEGSPRLDVLIARDNCARSRESTDCCPGERSIWVRGN